MRFPSSLDISQAADALRDLAPEFTVIENHGTLFPQYDVVPLAPCHVRPIAPLRAILMDMDGTTTLTEDLCLAALTGALRDATRRENGSPGVSGLNPERDYPHIIGTSASANIAYLVETYGGELRDAAFRHAVARASAWNLNPHRDPIRRAEAETTVRICGAASLLESAAFAELIALTDHAPLERNDDLRTKLAPFAKSLELISVEQRGRALLEIYYEYLHGYFAAIARDEGWRVAEAVYGDRKRPAIAPLPGIALACAMARGLLSAFPAACVQLVEAAAGRSATKDEQDALLRALESFAANPPQVALVTSSGYYEARTVLKEVFRGIRQEVAQWPLPPQAVEQLLHAFRAPEDYYDAIITADESHEIRLKPYRDLYTIAIRTLGLDLDGLRNTVGFEDTWAGVTAMRSAGVGIPCAVPFHGTRNHDLSLAAHVFHGGLPQAILEQALFHAPQ